MDKNIQKVRRFKTIEHEIIKYNTIGNLVTILNKYKLKYEIGSVITMLPSGERYMYNAILLEKEDSNFPDAIRIVKGDYLLVSNLGVMTINPSDHKKESQNNIKKLL